MSQILKKFIGDNEVGAAKVRLENDSYLKARNNSNTADVNILKLNTSDEAILVGQSSDLAINIQARRLYDLSEVNTIDFNSCELFDSSGVLSVNFSGRSINDPAGDAAIDYNSTTEIVIESRDLRLNGNNALKLKDGGSNYVNLIAPNTVTTTYDFVLPADDGTAGYVLQTDGAGVTSWVAQSGGGSTWEKETFTLSAGDITNGYIDLANVADTDSIDFVISGLISTEGTDYTVNYTGGAGGNTRITFSGHTPTLIAGDVVTVKYTY